MFDEYEMDSKKNNERSKKTSVNRPNHIEMNK